MRGINRAAQLCRLMVFAVLAGGLAVGVTNSTNAQQGDTGPAQIEVLIEAQPLNAALVQAGHQFGVVVVAPENLTEDKTSPLVSGALTADQAINKLLAGSGLEAQRLANGAFVVSSRPIERARFTSPCPSR